MPGLLRKLQKSRPPSRFNETASVVLLKSGDSGGLTPDSLSPIKEEGGKLIRRHTGLTQSFSRSSLIDGSVPKWNPIERKIPPRVDRLLLTASALLTGKLINRIDPLPQEPTAFIRDAIGEALGQVPMMPTRKEQEIAERELVLLVTTMGPLQPLFEDGAVSQIFVDDHKTVRAVRRGQLLMTPFAFRSREEYLLFANWLLGSRAHRLSEVSPIVDLFLNDRWQSRINALHPSVGAGSEPRLSIRIPRQQKLSFYDLLQAKILPATLAAWLTEIVNSREGNILIAGSFGSGKTLMTTALLSGIGSEERVVTIEDVPEIFVAGQNVEKLVARPAEGSAGVNMQMLFQAAVRRCPHRIVVGEIRGEEGKLFLRALETGYPGSMASLHAHSAEEALWRLLDIVSADQLVAERSLVRRISRAIHLVILMGRSKDRPVLMEVAEVIPARGRDFSLKALVRFHGVIEGKRQWRLLSESSHLIDELAKRGKKLRPGVGLLKTE